MAHGIPTSRAAQVLPFLDTLDRLGAPTENILERCKLPPSLRERPGMLVGTRTAFGFVDEMGRREGIEDFGWRAADPGLTQMTPGLRCALSRSPTLFHALERMCAGATGESSSVAFWLEERRDAVFLCHRGSLEVGVPGSRDASLMRTAIIISVIRLFTDPDWVPVECGLALEGEIGPVVREALRDARIRRTPDHGWLRLPRSILARPPRTRVPVEARAGTEADEEPALDLVGSLAQAVRPYLIQGGPSVRVAAEMAGTSVRSLQRELARAGSSYRNVLLSVKFDTACEVLKQPGAKILDAAHASGFSDQAHFTRFFRSLAGSTPHEYRSSQLQEDS